MVTVRLFVFLAVFHGAASAAEPVTFAKDIKPIFKQHCIGCHNADRPRGGLDLSTMAAVREGGTSGKAVVSGKPEESLLYLMPAHLEDPKMPPGKPKIPQRQLDLIRAWITGGLVEKSGNAPAVAAATGGLVRALPLPRATAITALAVSPSAPLVAVSGHKQILLFRLPTSELAGALPFPEGEVHVLRFSHDGRILLAGGGIGGQSGKVVGFDTESWRRAFEVGDEADVVLAADITADRSKVVLGGPGRVVKVFSTGDGKQLHAFRKPTDWVLSTSFSPEGLLVAAGDRFGGLYVWEAQSGKEFLTLRGHTKAVTGIAWRADSNAFASASEDGTIRIWDMHTGAESVHWQAHAGGVLAVDFHSGGMLASGGRDKRIHVWDGTGKRIANLGPAGDIVLRVGFAPGAKEVVAADWSGEIRVWPVAGGQSVKLDAPIEAKPAVAAVIPVPNPTPRPSAPAAPASLSSLRKDLADARQAAERANEELAAARKALAAAKDTVRAAEEAAAKARTAAGAVAALVETKTAQAQKEEERVRRLEEAIAKASGPAAGEGKQAALKATTEALARLNAARTLAPDNAALVRAIAETERALKELAAELERADNNTSRRNTRIRSSR
ncbi:MAG TPA: c-type cytochrome domain-containing protein [Gemmataceae bacterium]|nr:c-type cytochrome domain-containing protein [Gemmataceae bacterium]